jgi:2-dehydro-3-deoxy-D-pentonate aldolase
MTSSSTLNWPNGPHKVLQGIIPPLVTPLLDGGNDIDEVGTRRMIEHTIEGGVAGLFVLGTTGEGPSLSHTLRRLFVQLCCDIVQDRVPVLVGITDSSLVETLHMVQVARAAGASAVVLTTPFYFPLEQSELIRYVQKIMEQLEQDDNNNDTQRSMPLMLYNMPGLTKVWFEIDTVRTLAERYPRIVGIKDSSGNLEYFEKLCQLKREVRPDDWTVLMGPEHLTAASVALGGDGGVNGGSNVEPKLFVALYHAAAAKDTARVETLMTRIMAFQEIYTVCTPGFRYVTATKCALSLKNLCGDAMAEPFVPYGNEHRLQVERILNALPDVSLD